MMCPNCGGVNPESARYCGDCGHQLTPVDRLCPQCGAQGLAEDDRYCSSCGAPWDGPVARPGAALGHRTPPWVGTGRRVSYLSRPLWLVASLSVLTGGLYAPVWLGVTWAAMKRELRDDTMCPFWHALTFWVPVYAYFRYHAHYRTINELLERGGEAMRVRPGGAVVGLMIANALSGASASPGVVFAALWVAASTVVAATLVHGQSGLNAYQAATPGAPAAAPVSRWEWLLLLLGGLLTLGLIGSLVAAMI